MAVCLARYFIQYFSPFIRLSGFGRARALAISQLFRGCCHWYDPFQFYFLGVWVFFEWAPRVLVAQATGRKDTHAIAQWLMQSILLATVIGIALIILSPLIIDYGLPLFKATEAAAAQTHIYFDIRILSAPAVLCNYAIIGWLLGMQKPRGPLVILVTANLLNIVLDLILVLELGMATQGAAIATVAADYVSLGMGITLIIHTLQPQSVRWNWYALINKKSFAKLLLLNRHLFVRTRCLLFVQAFFTSQGAQLGDAVLAG